MLLRNNADGVVAITQPRHAWLAGELARAWGGGGFFVPRPRDALICATALHDMGWLDWERAPRIDVETGLPLTFDKVEATVHTKLWQSGVEAAGIYGALPTLHISRHGVAIYDLTFDRETARTNQVEAVDGFIARQQSFQAVEIAKLARDAETAAWITPQHLEVCRAFILAVDTLSLQLCWGVEDVAVVEGVPHVGGMVNLSLRKHSADQITVDPWPFVSGRLTILIEGKSVAPVANQSALDEALKTAGTVRQRVTLLPALWGPPA